MVVYGALEVAQSTFKEVSATVHGTILDHMYNITTNEQYHNKSCRSCDHSVPESVTHLLFECPRWNRYRKQVDEDIPDFFELLKKETYSHDQRVVFLSGGVPSNLEKSPEL